MEPSIWQKLPQPIVGLSPMDGVTDSVYRTIQKKYGQPDVVYTEFTSVEGVCNGAMKLLDDFLFEPSQRPIIAQVFGVTPDYYRQTAVLLCELGFDGIDINMGCPAKSVHKQGSGACLITTPELARDIVTAAKQGVTDYLNGMRSKDCPDIKQKIVREVERRAQLLIEAGDHPQHPEPKKIPVSVKTRIGFSEIVTEDWIKNLLEVEPEVITVHGRTLRQRYSGEANWEEIGKAAALTKNTSTLLFGNGDVADRAGAIAKCKTYGTNGVLIGRASFGNPFVFLPVGQKPTENIFRIALEHSQLFEATYPNTPDRNNFLSMRKHLGWYVTSIPNASQIRLELFKSKSSAEVEQIFKNHRLID